MQPPTLQDDLQKLVAKFTGIQGYDLAHGQFPDEVYNPDFDAHDAKTLNVLIPWDAVGSRSGCHYNYYTNIGSTITVQSLVTGQTLNLHVVGEYIPEDGTATPLFGKILADDSVVQTLSGGHPSYAYGLHLNMNQLQTVFERLHSSVPTAQLYDFTTDPSGPDTEPGYSRFTDPYPANLWDYYYSIVDPPLTLGEVAVFWAGLLAMIIVLNREAHTLIHHSGLWNRRKG